MRAIFLLLAFFVSAEFVFGFTGPDGNGVYDSTGTRADVQAVHDAVSSGTKVRLAAGVHTWTSAVTITKGIWFEGAGAGRVVARSGSSVLMGIGAKTFTLDVSTKLPAIEALKAAIVPGATLHIDRVAGMHAAGAVTGLARMTGTVTSYTGDTLVMDITSVDAGSGTHPNWAISTMPLTTINKANGAATLIGFFGRCRE